ncbi:GNAT family N-acetyltransferase [Amycolatopsis sp. NPDC051061]|uniref:GNAT family N-acetyltransferase n=1 Tax=Amycolatopsis sp. NPDC051061 TaxID=3155042 RepID=UPI0034148FDB
MTYHSTRLKDEHDVEAFDCEVESLNSWLRNEARKAEKAYTARTHVWTDGPDEVEVRAYFAFAPTALIRGELSSGQAGGQSGMIPGFLLGRLALDKSLRGQGLGTELLVDAIGRLVGAAEVSAGRLIVVDAIDDGAAAFYRKYGFTPVKLTLNRLVMKMATARDAMGVG